MSSTTCTAGQDTSLIRVLTYPHSFGLSATSALRAAGVLRTGRAAHGTAGIHTVCTARHVQIIVSGKHSLRSLLRLSAIVRLDTAWVATEALRAYGPHSFGSLRSPHSFGVSSVHAAIAPETDSAAIDTASTPNRIYRHIPRCACLRGSQHHRPAFIAAFSVRLQQGLFIVRNR